jgi:hypothetical protein
VVIDLAARQPTIAGLRASMTNVAETNPVKSTRTQNQPLTSDVALAKPAASTPTSIRLDNSCRGVAVMPLQYNIIRALLNTVSPMVFTRLLLPGGQSGRLAPHSFLDQQGCRTLEQVALLG